jgi:hypothetical protein
VEEELSAAFICRIHNALRSPARCSVLFVLVLMFMLFLHEHSITIDTQVHLDLSFAVMAILACEHHRIGGYWSHGYLMPCRLFSLHTQCAFRF